MSKQNIILDKSFNFVLSVLLYYRIQNEKFKMSSL